VKVLSITENETIARDALGHSVCRELQRLDEEWAASTGDSIFDWTRLKSIRAKNWVGVIEVPGLSVEILPKIDGLSSATARRNLLFMLALAGDLPVRERDIAGLAVENTSLLDALILVFSERLVEELRFGLDHAYVGREENSGFVRGKILLQEHLRRNLGHNERVYIAFDDFNSDTALNRILKRACCVLLKRARSATAERNLEAALRALDEVQDIHVQPHHFDQVQLTRASTRFETLLEFCRIVLLEGAPSLRAGRRTTFTLLFPMEKVFERFVARALVKHAFTLGLDSNSIAVQAKGVRRSLVFNAEGKGQFRLEPDVVVRGEPRPRLILDTKWKRLVSIEEDARNGVSQSDMYQMAAYATRYDCNQNVLLFPRVDGIAPVTYTLPVEPTARSIRIEFVNLAADLVQNRESLIADLRRIIGGDSKRATVAT
jgi:5-methylcytosine-specific restriction enzyme subunit McrC